MTRYVWYRVGLIDSKAFKVPMQSIDSTEKWAMRLEAWWRLSAKHTERGKLIWHIWYIWHGWVACQHTERSEEPLVLAGLVALLKGLLDGLLGVLTLGDLLEGVVGDNTLETLKLEGVAGGHDVVVVDDLDERLDLGALGNTVLAHAAGDLLRVTLDAGNESVREGVGLGALVDRLDDDDLLACIAATGDDGDTAGLEDCRARGSQFTALV